MTLSERVRMRSFAGATEWLDSEPLGPAELKGHAVGQRISEITFLAPAAAMRSLSSSGRPRHVTWSSPETRRQSGSV